jgi:predicted Zn finger-like uncharacterized protein
MVGHGMITLDIRGLDIVVLLQFLSDQGSTLLRKIWHSESRFTAVFVKDNFPERMLSGQAFVVVLDHDISANKCKVDAVAGATTSPSISPVFLESAFRRTMEELADKNGWHCEFVPTKTVYKGSKCPSCGATYEYPAEKVQDDGSVRCQNCNKTFIPGQE